MVLVVDGLGSSYVYPEHSAYALDGSPLGKAVLYNLTGECARVVDAQVPVPETTISHSILVTGSSSAGSQLLGPTIFDAARERGYLCLAVLERGDSMPLLQKMDGVLYLGDNSLHGAEPVLGLRSSAPPGLSTLLGQWRDRFANYTAPEGLEGYAGYNSWGLDSAADIIRHLPGRPFLMLVNVGAVDSAGQNLGAEGYLQTVAALDAPLGRLAEACRENGVLLVVTSDHGMSFPGGKGKGGHFAERYARRLESLRVPLVFQGPGVEYLNLGGRWSELDIAPTLLSMLNISGGGWEGSCLPLKERYDLQVVGCAKGAVLMHNGEPLANASGDRSPVFRGLTRGLYAVKFKDRTIPVLVNGDRRIDLGDQGALSGYERKVAGVILIMVINLVGVVLILRIIKKEG